MATASTPSSAPTIPDPTIERARALLASYLPIYDSYHSQKETMAYGVVTLYLGAASTLFLKEAFWKDYTAKQMGGMAFVLVCCAVLAFTFVRWQFRLCLASGEMYQACSTLLSQWITTPPKVQDVKTEIFPEEPWQPLFSGFEWPQVLKNRLDKAVADRDFFWRPRDVSYIVMAVWTVFVVVKILVWWHVTAPSFEFLHH